MFGPKQAKFSQAERSIVLLRLPLWRMIVLCVLFTLSIFFFTSVDGSAQTTTGSIFGTVMDTTNAVVPGVTVTVTNVQTGMAQMATSNASGNYIFPVVDPGQYIVSAAMTGFQTVTQHGIQVAATQNVHVNFSLQPGVSSQTVTVTAATTLVDTRESQLGETVDQRRIADLPLNGRNAYSLVTLVPGVTGFSGNTTIGSQIGISFNVNGNQADENSYYLDGAFDQSIFRNGGNLIPNPDALEEFRILTSNFDAEYGRSPGGVVNIITRSGTNHYHGLLYDYVRNNIFNAKNYFDTGVTPLVQNQFGANVGGPIHKDKAFFFLSYEGLRIQTPYVVASSSLVTPTPAEAKGDFRGDVGNPNVKLPNVSCNGVKYVICPNALDPVAQNILKTVPLANPNTGITPEQSAPANQSENQGLARIDYQLTQAHKLSGTFFNSRGLQDDPGEINLNQILDYSGISNSDNQMNVVVSDAWTISDNKLNTLRGFYTLNHYVIAPTISGNTLADLGSQVTQASQPPLQPQVQITGYWKMGAGGGTQNDQINRSIGAVNTFNWTHGNHTIKAGGSLIYNKFAPTGAFLGSGQFTFTGSTTGNALADFLEGKANAFTQNNGNRHRVHTWEPALFAQDDWRATNNLTLDLGLRWEVYPPFSGDNNTGTWVPFVQSKRFPTAPIGLLSSGDPGVPDGILHTSYTKFAPRIGFAYDMYGNGKTSLRGAYGIFYASARSTLPENLEQQPFTLSVTVNKTPNLVTPYAPNKDPFPYVVSTTNPVFTSGATLFGMPKGKNGISYVQEYNLALQQQLGTNWAMQIAYVGSTSRKFFLIYDANAPVYNPACTSATCGSTAQLNARRPYEPTPNTYVFSQINLTSPAANASYNSLQISMQRRFAHRFSLLASYVWSKNMDIIANFAEGVGQLTDETNPSRDWGPAQTSVPNSFVASYLWALPDVHRWSFLGKEVLSGWQLNGITTIQSGSPFTVTSGVDTNFDGFNNDRPNQIGVPVIPGHRSRYQKIVEYFNTAAFAQLPSGVPYGNVRRNSLLGPGYVDTDISAFKNFPIWRGTLQFRGEVFNLFNNVNLANPNSVLTSKQFGQISGASDPRIVQLALRYSF